MVFPLILHSLKRRGHRNFLRRSCMFPIIFCSGVVVFKLLCISAKGLLTHSYTVKLEVKLEGKIAQRGEGPFAVSKFNLRKF